jgi:hypothetical protein
MSRPPRIQFQFQPARGLGRLGIAQLVADLSDLARRARPEAELPAACGPAALTQRALALARNPDGALSGFASARLLPVPGLGEALHLETVRALGPERDTLSARLASAVVRGYCLRFSFPARLWCVFDSSGPCRLGEAVDREWVLGASCAVDEIARRLTRRAAPERWDTWLAGALTPVVCFEFGGRVLETGYVHLGAFVARSLRRRLGGSTWSGTPAEVSRSAA